MKILGVDYGRKKIGLSLAVSKIAEPLTVLRFSSFKEANKQLSSIIEKENPEKIVVGLSEGRMLEEVKNYVNDLKKNILIPIEFYDETLSTYEALDLSRKARIKRKKIKKMEDAYAASVMLQSYLDRYV